MKSKFQEEDMNLQSLNDAFPEVPFRLYKSMVSEKKPESFFSAITCVIDDESTLEDLWDKISSLISVDYQMELIDEFSRWNIYLMFITKQSVSNKVKYRIENDKFSVRKIVVDNFSAEPNLSIVVSYLNNHILSNDLRIEKGPVNLSTDDVERSEFTKNLMAANLPLGNSDKDKEKRSIWLNNAVSKGGDDEI